MLKASEAAALLTPVQILLRALFAERLGTPLEGISKLDIEMARVSFDLDQQMRAFMRKGEASPMDRYRSALKEKETARKNSISAKRHAAKLNRTPAWADQAAIKAVYAKARALTASTGIEHHVDHEVPLQGKRVSGLHVHHNLQILPGPENCRKNNRFEVT